MWMDKKCKGWYINGCFLDFHNPVTFEEAQKCAPKSGRIKDHREPTEFMKLFRKLRLDLGHTLIKISRKTNIKPSRLCDLEYGRAEPTEDEQKLLAACFDSDGKDGYK